MGPDVAMLPVVGAIGVFDAVGYAAWLAAFRGAVAGAVPPTGAVRGDDASALASQLAICFAVLSAMLFTTGGVTAAQGSLPAPATTSSPVCGERVYRSGPSRPRCRRFWLSSFRAPRRCSRARRIRWSALAGVATVMPLLADGRRSSDCRSRATFSGEPMTGAI